MDEKKMAEEFAKIWKAVGENSGAIIETNKDLKNLANYQASLARHYSRHIDIFNKNVDVMNQNLRMFQKYAKRQNIIIITGIGGFLYLCKKIQKLEDATKKE
jgi:hypothetical protein|nr:MAG TPA: hypothetical protein [Caudoviricetes sp.]